MIEIRQQFKACFRRRGFSHCVVAFTTSGIIINTLSTFMDYLVTLNGAGREYVGIVGGTFQILIMCSSLVFRLFLGWIVDARGVLSISQNYEANHQPWTVPKE
ncbi:hypothetical protein ACHAXA_009477 [Cyclostephanos tholiformis]|uniref:Uncharacterized protein n=1 Tax=Cyclostephanos tholiformis TaxID=382380 RepID=A0ABD3R356_9STRA